MSRFPTPIVAEDVNSTRVLLLRRSYHRWLLVTLCLHFLPLQSGSFADEIPRILKATAELDLDEVTRGLAELYATSKQSDADALLLEELGYSCAELELAASAASKEKDIRWNRAYDAYKEWLTSRNETLFEASIRDLRLLVAAQAKDLAAMVLLGNFFREAGNLDDALSWQMRALKRATPEFIASEDGQRWQTWALGSLARTYLLRGDFKRSQRLSWIILHRDTNHSYRHTYAASLMGINEWEAAVAQLNEVVKKAELHEDKFLFPIAVGDRGIAMLRLGRKNEGLSDLKRALAVAPINVCADSWKEALANEGAPHP